MNEEDKPKRSGGDSTGRRRRKRALARLVGDRAANPILAAMVKSAEARAWVRGLLALRGTDAWRLSMAVPASSFLEVVLGEFQSGTNIALELPFFAVLHSVAQLLLSQGVRVQIDTETYVSPDPWTVLLAESGAGKTFTINAMKKVCGDDLRRFPDRPSSSAAVLDCLQEYPSSLWFLDEFAQYLRSVKTLPHHSETIGYLLQAAVNETITKKLKRTDDNDGMTTVERPCITVLGATVHSTFLQYMGPEEFLSGFAQRFSYVIAPSDPRRSCADFPLWRLDYAVLREAWERFRTVKIHSTYRLSSAAIKQFEETFRLLFSIDHIEESFYRRIMFRAIKYAVIGHVLCEKATDEIDAHDIGFGAKICSVHLTDCKQLVDESGLTQVGRMLARISALKQKMDGKLTPRIVIQQVYGIRTVAEARALMEIAE